EARPRMSRSRGDRPSRMNLLLRVVRVAGIFLLVLVALVLIVCAVRLSTILDKHASPDDAYVFLIAGWDEHTTYAPRFTESRFRSLRVGMPVEQVIALIGTPLDTVNSGELWRYSVGDSLTGFWARSLSVDSTRRVTGIHAEFYWD